MNKRWLARAKQFETPPVGRLFCVRGHDLEVEGIYSYTQTRNGQKYGARKCRRCAIENVQRSQRKRAMREMASRVAAE